MRFLVRRSLTDDTFAPGKYLRHCAMPSVGIAPIEFQTPLFSQEKRAHLGPHMFCKTRHDAVGECLQGVVAAHPFV